MRVEQPYELTEGGAMVDPKVLMKALETLALVIGIWGTILVGKTQWTVSGEARIRDLAGMVGGGARGSVSGQTVTPQKPSEWARGWRLITAVSWFRASLSGWTTS